jgi:hypothetical protein
MVRWRGMLFLICFDRSSFIVSMCLFISKIRRQRSFLYLSLCRYVCRSHFSGAVFWADGHFY